MVRRILLPALLVWCAGTASALDSSRRLTQYVHRIWTTQQGLPPGTIYDIWQTRDSFLWLGTQTGLVRFDGVRFTAAETLYPGLPENLWVRSGFEDAEGAMWVSTNDAGIYRIRDGSVTHYSTKEGLPSDQVYCLIPGSRRNFVGLHGKRPGEAVNRRPAHGREDRDALWRFPLGNRNRARGLRCAGRKALGRNRRAAGLCRD